MSLRILGLIGISMFVASAFSPLPNLVAGLNSRQSHLEEADAIVVLGAGIQPDESLTNASFRRAVYGIRLHHGGLAKLLVLLGPARSGSPAEARVRAEIARELGIAPETIVREESARTTREEAAVVAALLRPRGIRKIILVTDSQHMPRARGLFQRAGFEILPAPADDFSIAAVEPEERLQLMLRVLREMMARLYYRIAGYL